MEDKKLEFTAVLSPSNTTQRGVTWSIREITTAANIDSGSLHSAQAGAVQLPLGVLADGSITAASRYSAAKFSGMTTSVVMKEPFVAPGVGVTFSVAIDDALKGLKVKVYYGYNEGMSSTTSNVSKYSSDELADGGSFTFPVVNDGAGSGYDMARYYYRIAFVSSSLAMTAEDIAEAIRLGHLAVTFVDHAPDVVSRHPRATEIIEVSKAAKTVGDPSTRHRNYVFTHISDMHANAIALHDALDYSAAVGSQGLFITGDVVAQSSFDGFGYVHHACKDYGFPSFLTTGNHDGVGVSSLASFNNMFFADMAATFGYKRGSGMGYYYMDLAQPKIRVIALDCSDTSVSYRISSIGSTQVTWLQNTLSATPAGYGVIILLHQPLGNPTAESRSAHPSFAKYPDLSSSDINWTGASAVRAAVDNFITGGGEFIMYCCGHFHADIVGVIAGTTHTQLMACIASPNGLYDMQNDVCSVGDGARRATFSTPTSSTVRGTPCASSG